MGRRATIPIPDQVREQFYLAAWDLAWIGTFYRVRVKSGSLIDKFGRGSLVARRHGLVILWLTAAAMRFSELATAKYEQLDVNARRIFVMGAKGSAKGETQVNESLVECTEAWRRRIGFNSELLLPSSTNAPIDNNAFNRDVMTPMGALFGIRLSAHALRDTAAQQALAVAESKGLGVQAVQGFMRHRSLASTEHYLRKHREKSIEIEMHSPCKTIAWSEDYA